MITQILDGIAVTAGFFSLAFMLFSGKYIRKVDKENKELKKENAALEKACTRWKVRYERDTGRKVLREGE